MNRSIAVLGCKIDALTEREAVDALITDIDRVRAGQKSPQFVVTIGTEMIVRAQSDAQFRSILQNANYSLCDTIGVLLVSRMRRGPLRERVAGVDLVGNLCSALAKRNGSIFLFGARDTTAQQAAAKLLQTYPGLRIAGARNGYFSEDESSAIAAEIRSVQPDILFVGLGSPRQEFWLAAHLGQTDCPIGIGVGGSFDVISGQTARAPRILQALGLEWLYRLMREPQRWRRQLALPYFVYLAVMESMAAILVRRSAKR